MGHKSRLCNLSYSSKQKAQSKGPRRQIEYYACLSLSHCPSNGIRGTASQTTRREGWETGQLVADRKRPEFGANGEKLMV